jgi:hypothetical protein
VAVYELNGYPTDAQAHDYDDDRADDKPGAAMLARFAPTTRCGEVLVLLPNSGPNG